ncbi:MAG: hypothetical protein ABIP90_10070, partial [Vicinamibacterales bacterium]
LNCATPLFGPDNVLFMSSAYQAGSRAVQLTENGNVTDVEELWFTNRVRFMFLNAIRVGDFVYGTTGDFGPAFLTALNIKTGESAWQVRGFARASLLYADGKVIVMNEDGDLALARLTPTGADILARTKVFDTTSWTAPTLVGTTLFARDREKIVALNLGAPDGAGSKPAPTAGAGRPGPVSPSALAPIPPPAVLSGSWKLDAATSIVTPGAPFAGLHPTGAPPWLFLTQPANGALIVESALNTSHTRYYRPGKVTTTDVASGTITMNASWVGKALVGEGKTTMSSGVVTAVKEALSRDGDTLVVKIVAGDKISKLRYTRLTDVGPCSTWPAPCKKAPGLLLR